MALSEYSAVERKKTYYENPGPGAYDLPSDFDHSKQVMSKASTMKFRVAFGSTEVLTGTNAKVGPGSYDLHRKFGADAPAFTIPESGINKTASPARQEQEMREKAYQQELALSGRKTSPTRWGGVMYEDEEEKLHNNPRSGGTSPVHASDLKSTKKYPIGSKLALPGAQPDAHFSPGPGQYAVPSSFFNMEAYVHNLEKAEEGLAHQQQIVQQQQLAQQQNQQQGGASQQQSLAGKHLAMLAAAAARKRGMIPGATLAFRPEPPHLKPEHRTPGPADYQTASQRFPNHNERHWYSEDMSQKIRHRDQRQHGFGATLPEHPLVTPAPGDYHIPSCFDPPKREAPPPVVPGANASSLEGGGMDVDGASGGVGGDASARSGGGSRMRTTFGGRGATERRVKAEVPGPGAYEVPSSLNLAKRHGVTISGRYREYHDMDDVYPVPGPAKYAPTITSNAKRSVSYTTTFAPPHTKPVRVQDEGSGAGGGAGGSGGPLAGSAGDNAISSDQTFERGVYHPEKAEQYYSKKGPNHHIANQALGQPTPGEKTRKEAEKNLAERRGDDDSGPFGHNATRGARRHKCPFGQVHSAMVDLPHKLSGKNPPSFSMSFRTPVGGGLFGPADPTIPGPCDYFDFDKEQERKTKCAVKFSDAPFLVAGGTSPRIMTVEERKDYQDHLKHPNKKRPEGYKSPRKASPRTPGAPVSSPASGIDYYLNKLGGQLSATQRHRAPGPNHYDDVKAWDKLHSPRSVKLSPRTPHTELPSRINNNSSSRKIPAPPPPASPRRND